MSKYNEILNRVEVSEDMKARIVEAVDSASERKDNTLKFPNLKKYLSVAASVAIVALVTMNVPSFFNGSKKSEMTAARTNGGGYYFSDYESTNSIGYDYGETAVEKDYVTGSEEFNTANKVNTTTGSGEIANIRTSIKKIIYTAKLDLRIDSEEYNETINSIKHKVEEIAGYIESFDSYSYSYSSYTYMTVRIPVESYRAFLDSLSGYGEMSAITENSQDITAQYMDIQSRLNGKITERDRLYELLTKAVDITDIFMIEDKIAELQSDIEYYQSVINGYDNKVSYCTVTINITSNKSVTYTEPTFIEKLTEAVKNGLSNVGYMFEGIILFVAEYGIVIAIIIAFIYGAFRFIRKKFFKK